MRAAELAQRIEDVANGLSIPAHRKELEGVARELRELGPNAPADPLAAFDEAIGLAQDLQDRKNDHALWGRAIAYGIRALVDAPHSITQEVFLPAVERATPSEAELRPPPLSDLTVPQLVACLRNDVKACAWAGVVEIPAVLSELAQRDLNEAEGDLTEEELAGIQGARDHG